ncbi:protease S8 tripeptidyl peptidase I like protein [Zymoseptoria brevis]|uniref:Protease S8 tripeptidyl peptidase I like protein n=1 Tax=Zymoseptoria brevis TaxID=1047168 RepID=A0A0F4GXA5_9PEZI|nr:protease S8 tripeptidyl peptidase I like protein [Zymoseptoria brevis]
MTRSLQFKLFSSLYLASLARSSPALPQRGDFAPADGSAIVRAAVAFHQPRLQEAEAILNDISDPASERFGNYLDSKQLQELFAPAEESVAAVEEWLNKANISSGCMHLKTTSSTLEFDAEIGQLDELFATTHYWSKHPETRKVKLLHEDYVIPSHLQKHIEFAHFLTTDRSKSDLRKRKTQLKNGKRGQPDKGKGEPVPLPPYKDSLPLDPAQRANCSENWTPACIRELYSLPSPDPNRRVADNNAIGIFGFGDMFNQTDLTSFFTSLAPHIPPSTAPDVHYINGADLYATHIDGEENLDIQMAYPIIHPQKMTIFQTPYNGLGGIANDFLDAVDSSYCDKDGGDDPDLDPHYPAFQGFAGPRQCGTQKITNVLSVSFALDESSLPIHYVQRQCAEWMKLALMGTTVLVSSGDGGVKGLFSCLVNPLDKSKDAFNPLFPGTCPYITTVGAHQVTINPDSTFTPIAIDDKKHNYWSSGGFSNVLPQPSYQSSAVATYLSSSNPSAPHYPPGTYNATGRAFPDVAMLGANVTISDEGKFRVSGGTSAAAPLFAAMITRINDERLLKGKKAIGFLNQILYAHPEVFEDIVVGSSPGCGTEGFKCAKGWDPVTGLGSPVFPKLRDLLVGLP